MTTERYSDFDDLPWCQELLNSPDIKDITIPTRQPPPPADRIITNTLFNKTWRSDTTVRAWKSLQQRNVMGPDAYPENYLLLSLGTGLDSHHKKLHGGACATMLDQAVGITSFEAVGPTFTKELNVRYEEKVPLPSCVLCRSKVTRRKGRAVWISASIEDGKGKVYCDAEALCIIPPQEGKKPAKL